MEHSKYINPFTDFGFKKIFGEEANKDLLIDFLNELLAYENEKIADLTYKKNEHLGLSGIDRNVIFDLFCENEKGEKFNVELQKAKQSFFKDRMVYYSSFSIQEQGKKGLIKGKDDKYRAWNYELKAVYVIGILDFIIDENHPEKIVLSHNKIMDTKRKTVFYDKLTFITLQMPNFSKSIDELETNFDKWLYVIQNLSRLKKSPKKLQEKIFQKVFNIAEYTAMTKQEKDSYENSLKYYRDLQNSLDTANSDGRAEGKAETEKKYSKIIEKKDQILEQKEQALQQKEQALFESAKLMKKAGILISEIQKSTGLTEEEIQNL